MSTVRPAVLVAPRPRAYVRVEGPGAEGYLHRMLSNDVAALAPGESCEALLLTAKARVIAPMRVLRRGVEDFLLLTEPELGEALRAHLVQFRFAARAAIELEEHTSVLLLGEGVEPPSGAQAVENGDYGLPGWEVLDAEIFDGEPASPDELERFRIEAGTPRWGREIDERVLPAEAGLVERAVSLGKGCYPGQEPIARLHYRGHANRGLRRLQIETGEPPGYDAEVTLDGKVVGRVTSVAPVEEGILALAYLRTEVPGDADLRVGAATARPLH